MPLFADKAPTIAEQRYKLVGDHSGVTLHCADCADCADCALKRHVTTAYG